MNSKVKPYYINQRNVEVCGLNLGRRFPALEAVPEDLRGTLQPLRPQFKSH